VEQIQGLVYQTEQMANGEVKYNMFCRESHVVSRLQPAIVSRQDHLVC